MIRQSRPKLLGVGIALVIWAWLLMDQGTWPEIYTFWFSTVFGHDKGLSAVPVYLNDDVMIVLRAGRILLDTGIPAMNRTDLAQPATSYLLPYLAALLLFVLPANVAVMALAALGVVAVAITLATIVFSARSTPAGVVLAVLLGATSTNLTFALNGWDHLFSGMFLTLAAALILTMGEGPSRVRLLTVSLLLFLAIMAKLDGFLIALSLIATAFLIGGSRRNTVLSLVIPFAALTGLALTMNVVQFGHLLPTTVRLKFGASPSWAYSRHYIVENTFFSYSAATLLLILIALALVTVRSTGWRHVIPLTVGCSITAGLAVFNSDVKAGARMFWVPAAVMVCLIAVRIPRLLTVSYQSGDSPALRRGIAVAGSAVAALLLVSGLSNGLTRAVVGPDNDGSQARPGSGRPDLFLLADWIDHDLQPADGAVGLFAAGTSFFLPRFEVADFLGKGDEMIAALPSKYGAPGHNKWDVDLTLGKWNPQAIIFNEDRDVSAKSVYLDARSKAAAGHGDFWFADAFIVNATMRSRYRWCAVTTSPIAAGSRLSLLLRNDIAQRPTIAPLCRTLWLPPA